LWFKKVEQRDISLMCREVPRLLIVTRLCTQIDTAVIACAKFGGNRLKNTLFMYVQKCLFPIKTVVTITTASTAMHHDAIRHARFYLAVNFKSVNATIYDGTRS